MSFVDQTCSAPAERSNWMRDLVLAHVPRDRRISVLDVGCGTGSLLLRLADALPAAALTGVDVSPANVRAARAQQAAHPAAARLEFETADYFAYAVAAAPFDAIVTDGVLHLIPGDTTILLRKLAGDMAPGGVLVCSLPYDCAYNRAFAALRRGLRVVRAPWLDEIIVRVGRLLHGRQMTDAGLRERIPYMYMPPERMMNRTFAAAASSAGLAIVGQYPMKSTSLSQLKHCAMVFTRTTTEAT